MPTCVSYAKRKRRPLTIFRSIVQERGCSGSFFRPLLVQASETNPPLVARSSGGQKTKEDLANLPSLLIQDFMAGKEHGGF